MPLDYDKLMNWPFEAVEQTYTEKDSILYALGIGLGADPADEAQLRFVFEEPELIAFPTMPVVLATPGFWARDPETGIDWVKILHGEQGLEIHNPLPAGATVTATTKITGILDKGPDKGALIYSTRTIADKANSTAYATLTSTTFARGDGGFGGASGPAPEPHPIPERAPDTVCDLPTLPQAALIYRLSGDPNPLHADPKVARAAGFDRPILHGLCTFGVAGHALLRTICDYDVARFKGMKLRFSAPVYPGETIRTEMWDEGGGTVAFRARVVERDVVVLDNGRMKIDAR